MNDSHSYAMTTYKQPFAVKLSTLAVCAALGAVPLFASTPVVAATATAAAHSYDISAGPLSKVLQQFASEAGIMLSVDARLTAGKNSNGLHGSVSVAEGLHNVLSGTGLEAKITADNSYTVVRAADIAEIGAPANAMALETVTVEATSVRSAYKPRQDASTLRTSAPALETAQMVSVVPAQVIKDQHPRNLDDALTNISGLTQANTLASTQDAIMMRGFGDNRNGSIMVNGMPVTQGRSMNAAVDDVEVLKGPASLLYGIMDPGGVVNVVTKKPSLDAHTSVTLSGSTYGSGKSGTGETIDTTGPIGDSQHLAYRVVVDHVDEDYWRNFGSHHETLVAPSLAWYDDQTQIVASYQYRKFLTPSDRGTVLNPVTKQPLNVPATERLDEPFNNMWGESHLAQLTFDRQLGNDWKAHLGLSYNRETYDANQLRVTSVNTTTHVLSRANYATKDALSTDAYGVGYLDGKMNIAGFRNDIQVGADVEYRQYYRGKLIRQATQYSFNYLNPIYGREASPSTVSAADSAQTNKLHDQSVFFQDSVHLNDKWIVVGGLRFQNYHQLAGKGIPFHVNTDSSDSKWVPRAGVIYKINDIASWYTSYTQSMKPSSSVAALDGGAVITSAMKPETAVSWETGLKFDVPDKLTATIALFQIKKKNVLVEDTDSNGDSYYRTSGEARSQGIEVDVSGQLSKQWSAIASYGYLDAKTTVDPEYTGKNLVNVAHNTASLSLVYDAGLVGPGKLRIGGGPHYVGKRAGDDANSFVLQGYTVADAFATYDTKINGQKVKFQFNVKNMFNKVYYTSTADSQYFISLGDARQVSLSATFDF